MNKIRHGGWRYLTIVTIVFLLGTGAWLFMKPIQQSKQLEQQLVERFGWAPEFTAPANGTLAADRLERFMRVREAVQPNCGIFLNIMDNVVGLEKLESDPNLSAGEKTSEGFESFKSMLGNQLTALQATDQYEHEVFFNFGEALKAEMAALEADPDRSPWPVGPPAIVKESLAPYQDRISALYCPGIVRIEILQKNKRFSFDG